MASISDLIEFLIKRKQKDIGNTSHTESAQVEIREILKIKLGEKCTAHAVTFI